MVRFTDKSRYEIIKSRNKDLTQNEKKAKAMLMADCNMSLLKIQQQLDNEL